MAHSFLKCAKNKINPLSLLLPVRGNFDAAGAAGWFFISNFSWNAHFHLYGARTRALQTRNILTVLPVNSFCRRHHLRPLDTCRLVKCWVWSSFPANCRLTISSARNRLQAAGTTRTWAVQWFAFFIVWPVQTWRIFFELMN